MNMTAPNPAKRSRWLGWEPKPHILEHSAESGPTKPSKPGSVGFVGATPGNSRKIETVFDTIRSAPPASFTTCAEFKAAMLNRLLQEQGTLGQPGRITAATVRHGEIGHQRSSVRMAVVCDANRGTRPGQLDRIDRCAQCAVTEWRSVGGAWACTGCGGPPRRPAPNPASLKVDSLTTNEQPMSTAEAAE